VTACLTSIHDDGRVKAPSVLRPATIPRMHSPPCLRRLPFLFTTFLPFSLLSHSSSSLFAFFVSSSWRFLSRIFILIFEPLPFGGSLFDPFRHFSTLFDSLLIRQTPRPRPPPTSIARRFILLGASCLVVLQVYLSPWMGHNMTQDPTPRSTLTQIGGWKLGETLGRGAYGKRHSPSISGRYVNLCSMVLVDKASA